MKAPIEATVPNNPEPIAASIMAPKSSTRKLASISNDTLSEDQIRVSDSDSSKGSTPDKKKKSKAVIHNDGGQVKGDPISTNVRNGDRHR